MRLLLRTPLPAALESAFRALAEAGRCTLVEEGGDDRAPTGEGRWDAALADASQAVRLAAGALAREHRPLIVWGGESDALAALEAGADLWVDPEEPPAVLFARVSAVVRAARRGETPRVDPATGFHTLAAFEDLLPREFDRAVRYRRRLALLILEPDAADDPPGGASTPPASQAEGIADLLRSFVREVDLPARLGGRRFALLCPETDGVGALSAARRLLGALELADGVSPRASARPRAGPRVSFSVGVAAFPGRGIERPVHLYGRALESLFQAHRAGGGRAVVFGAPEIVWSREAPDPRSL